MASKQYRVTWEDAVRAHDKALEFGGAPGIINENAVRSALYRPYNGYFPDLHWKAAALVHAIVSNHGFVDGNKRTAFIMMKLLIEKNGHDLNDNDEKIADIIVDVASGKTSFEELVVWFESRLVLSQDSKLSS